MMAQTAARRLNSSEFRTTLIFQLAPGVSNILLPSVNSVDLSDVPKVDGVAGWQCHGHLRR